MRPPLSQLRPGLTRQEIIERVKKSLQFATKHISNLDGDSEYWSAEIDSLVRRSDKACIEAILLALIASRIPDPGPEVGELIENLGERIAPMVRSERNAILLMKFPHTSVPLGVAHAALNQLGFVDSRFDDLLHKAVASPHIDAVERLTFRSFELCWLRRILQPSIEFARQPEFGRLLQVCILSSSAHPIHLLESEAYAITHELMYVTDFGALPIPAALHVDRVARKVDASLAWHILSGNLDLLAEMLMGTTLTQTAWSPYARLAWRVLVDNWDRLGFVPSPDFDANEYALLEDGHEQYLFRHAYHTTYVSGILCALLLRHPDDAPDVMWSPPVLDEPTLVANCQVAIADAGQFCQKHSAAVGNRASVRSGHSVDNHKPAKLVNDSTVCPAIEHSTTEGVNRLITYLLDLDEGSNVTWLKTLPEVLPEPQDQLLVVADALLIAGVRNYDLALVSRVLSLVAAEDCPLSDTAIEATQFLLRQQVPCGAIGAYFVSEDNIVRDEAVGITACLAYALLLISKRLLAAQPVTAKSL